MSGRKNGAADMVDFRPQVTNANRHNQRGMGMLTRAMQQSGYVAPMTATADGEIIDGSARLEVAADVFDGVAPIVVDHDGTRPVIMRRTDIPDASDPRAVRIALESNRIAQVDLEWDADVLAAIGEDPDRDGLRDTPARWARWWAEFAAGDTGNHETTFETIKADQMVVVSGLRVWSLCEHHMLPFWCDITIGVVTGERILGLSKFGRIARHAAGRLQVQERLVEDIADRVSEIAGCQDVAVIATGEHLCMTMRGAKMPARMTTSVTRGRFRDDARTRAEFLALAVPRA